MNEKKLQNYTRDRWFIIKEDSNHNKHLHLKISSHISEGCVETCGALQELARAFQSCKSKKGKVKRCWLQVPHTAKKTMIK